MSTWLDQYAFHTCAIISDGVGRDADVRERMKHYCEFSATRIGMAQFEGACLDADLLPFFDARFKNVRAAYRVEPTLARGFGAAIASDADLALFQEHVRHVNYTFIDCPPGAMPLGADVEGRAIFAKTAQVTRNGGSEAQPGGMALELVIARTGRISRQTLSFDRACTSHVTHDADVDATDGADFEDMLVRDSSPEAGVACPRSRNRCSTSRSPPSPTRGVTRARPW